MAPVGVAPATLAVMYTLTGLWVAYDEARLVRQGHRVLHYRSLFNCFISAWMLLRVAYWLVAVTGASVPRLVADLLFWLPHTAMFLTFATLALFITKVVHGPQWSGALRRRYLRAYAAVAVINVLGTVTCSVLDAQLAGDGAPQQDVEDAESAGSGLLFLLLAGGFA